MMMRMKAIHESQDPSTGRRPGGKKSQNRVLVLANNLPRGEWIERRIGCATDANILSACLTYRDGLERLSDVRPALVIMDVEDISIDPLHCLKQIKNALPETHVLVISRTGDATLASRSLRAGASAYLTAEEADALLDIAIAHIGSGSRYVSEEIMQGILHGMVESGSGENRLPIEVLSDREMVVFQLIGQGRTFREIADELGVNIKTVATHCNNIRRKLHSRDNRHLTRISRNWVAERDQREPSPKH